MPRYLSDDELQPPTPPPELEPGFVPSNLRRNLWIAAVIAGVIAIVAALVAALRPPARLPMLKDAKPIIESHGLFPTSSEYTTTTVNRRAARRMTYTTDINDWDADKLSIFIAPDSDQIIAIFTSVKWDKAECEWPFPEYTPAWRAIRDLTGDRLRYLGSESWNLASDNDNHWPKHSEEEDGTIVYQYRIGQITFQALVTGRTEKCEHHAYQIYHRPSPR